VTVIFNYPLTFILRAVFVAYLSVEYFGLNSFIVATIGTFSILQLGVGSAMSGPLVHAMARKEYSLAKALIGVLRKFYYIIGMLILVIGCIFSAFIPNMLNVSADVNYVYPSYFVVLASTVLSYFFQGFRPVLTADMKQYIANIIELFVTITTTVVQIILLVVMHNFLVFMICYATSTLANSFIQFIVARKHYSFLKNEPNIPINDDIKKHLKNNFLASAVVTISANISFKIDSILITAFRGLWTAGIFAGIMVLVDAINKLVANLIETNNAVFGNIYAQKSKPEVYIAFKKVIFVVYVITFGVAIALSSTIRDVLVLWLGNDYNISNSIVIGVTFYLLSLVYYRHTAFYFNASAMIKLSIVPNFIMVSTNLTLSILVLKFTDFGIAGLFFVNSLCVLFLPLLLSFKKIAIHVLDAPPRAVLTRIYLNIGITLGVSTLWFFIANVFFFAHPSPLVLIVKLLASLMLFILFLLAHRKTAEYIFFIGLFRSLLTKFGKKLSKKV
jgi:O-antigen/teichoic acid export membrane protein